MEDKELMEALKKRPAIRKQVERLLNLSGNGHEAIMLADDAEEATIEVCREIGKAALVSWAETQALQSAQRMEQQVKSANKHIKKKCVGKVPSEK